MTEPTIYHGTPMTPRAALQQMAGRAFCVSFYRPDDVEVVEAISPAVMFRQRCVFVLAISVTQRERVGGRKRLEALLPMVRAKIKNGPLGRNSRQSISSFSDKRWAFERLAFWSMGRTFMAYGQSYRPLIEVVRQIRTSLLGMDRAGEGRRSWLRGMVSTHGRSCKRSGQPMARYSHDARGNGCAGVSFSQCGQHQFSAEWASI
jgi:hypothetical protein